MRTQLVLRFQGQNPKAEMTRKTSVTFTTPSPVTSSSQMGSHAFKQVEFSPRYSPPASQHATDAV